MKGENPVFDKETIVNVGTDEYDGRYAEQFRKFTDDLLAYVQENGNQVRLWGSLSERKGETQVRSEGVQMNIWNDGWAKPKEMYKEGYDLIDMNDGTVYIVPAAGYYGDYLNKQHLYNNYDPAKRMGVPVGSKQTLGGAYAIWNDMVDKKANGLTEMEIYDRFNDAAPFYASSLWGDEEKTYEEAAAVSENVGEAPRTNAYDRVDSKDATIVSYDFDEGLKDKSANGYDAKDAVNAKVQDNAFVLNGKESYVTTPIDRVGPGKELSFDITMTKPGMPGQILFEADAEYGTYDIRIMEDGTLGFTREGYDYSFGYKLPVNQKVSLTIRAFEADAEYGTYDIRIMEDGTLGFTREGYDYSFGYKLPVNQKVSLTIRADGNRTVLVSGEQTFEATGSYTYEGNLKTSGISRASLSLPTERIGSKTNAVNAVMDNIVLTSDVQKENMTEGAIDSKDFSVVSDNENADGKIQNAFDNDPSSIWHTKWSPETQELPATITIDMKKDYDVNGFYYMPRTSGDNGHITKYSLYYEDEAGEMQLLVEDGTWPSNGAEKKVMFKPVKTSKVQLVVKEGKGGFGSAAELKVLEGTKDFTKQSLSISTYVEGNGTAKVSKNEIIKGEEVTFTAEAKGGATFIGWYDVFGNEVSKEASYKVTPEDNLTLIAKFEGGEKPVEPGEADKKELRNLYDACVKADRKEEDYTADTWKAYTAAMKNAKAVLDKGGATEKEIADAFQNLNHALSQLKRVDQPVVPGDSANRNALEKYYKECLAYYKEADYTADSWKVYEAALAKVEAVLADKNATAEDIKAATDELAKAAQNLVKKDGKPSSETPNDSGKKPVTGDTTTAPMMVVLAAAASIVASIVAGKEILKKKRTDE